MAHLSSPVDLVRNRLVNQQLVNSRFKKPEDVVGWLGAVQAQEYAMSKWALAMRVQSAVTDQQVQNAFDAGSILRTHVLRPTWHFVTPEDIRWMLALTGPRLQARNGTMYRQQGLTSAILKRGTDTIAKALEGGKCLTRQELKTELERARLKTAGIRLGYFMMSAELDRVICSGPRSGKQFTYALLDERAPLKKEFSFDREESLAGLAIRYFTSRGPATVKDFATWASLTVKDASTGAHSLPNTFSRESLLGQEYFFKLQQMDRTIHRGATFLMADYDEYGMGYKDRSAILDTAALRKYQARGATAKAKNPIFNRMIVIDGIVSGTWRRTLVKGKAVVETYPFTKLDASENKALTKAIKRFQAFAGNELIIDDTDH